ncbi:hypothetical protein pb186bvf_014759 [Paramecium bursaria]
MTVIELNIKKIWCTMCVEKIQKAFSTVAGIQTVLVNIISENVIISFDPALINLANIIVIFNENDFEVVGKPREINQFQNQTRVLNLKISLSASQSINLDQIQMPGIQQVNHALSNQFLDISIIYQPLIVSGFTIYENILNQFKNKNIDKNHLIIVNQVIDRIKPPSHQQYSSFRLIYSLILTVFSVTISMILPQFQQCEFLYEWPQHTKCKGVIIVFYMMCLINLLTLGLRIYKNAWFSFMKHRILNMDTLLTLGSISAFLLSNYLIVIYFLQDNGHQKHEMMNILENLLTSLLILTIVTIGKNLEEKAKIRINSTQNNVIDRHNLELHRQVTKIQVKNQDYDILTKTECEVTLLEKGDLIELNQYTKLLCDGYIVKGHVSVIDSMQKGDIMPQILSVGSRIRSGAVILQGSCIFQVEQTIENSFLSQILEKVNIAQANQLDKQDSLSILLVKTSQYFVLTVILIAFLTIIVWSTLIYIEYIQNDVICLWCIPFERSISVLVASCPCSLGLAVPSVIAITLNIGLKQGILIKRNQIFTQFNKINAVVFDKTGTLFTKMDQFDQCQKLIGESDELKEPDVWAITEVMERDFKDPIAVQLFKLSLNNQNGKFSQYVVYEKAIKQRSGIIGKVIRSSDNKIFNCLIGSIEHMRLNNLQLDPQIIQACQTNESNGNTNILISIDGHPKLILSFNNKKCLRSESKQLIEYIQRLNYEIYILSGDSQRTVSHVGKHLNLKEENCIGNKNPEEKQQIIKNLKQNNSAVIMIGDGMNDTLSLQEAEIGISINSESQLNLIASDIIFLNENLWNIAILLNLIRTSKKVITTNLFLAFSYNIIMIPFVVGLFYKWDIVISPMVSSIAMSVSSITVVLLSNLMNCINYDPSRKYNKPVHVNDSYVSIKSTQQYLQIESSQ